MNDTRINELKDCVKFRHSVTCDDVAYLLSQIIARDIEIEELKQMGTVKQRMRFAQKIDQLQSYLKQAIRLIEKMYANPEFVNAREIRETLKLLNKKAESNDST